MSALTQKQRHLQKRAFRHIFQNSIPVKRKAPFHGGFSLFLLKRNYKRLCFWIGVIFINCVVCNGHMCMRKSGTKPRRNRLNAVNYLLAFGLNLCLIAHRCIGSHKQKRHCAVFAVVYNTYAIQREFAVSGRAYGSGSFSAISV